MEKEGDTAAEVTYAGREFSDMTRAVRRGRYSRVPLYRHGHTLSRANKGRDTFANDRPLTGQKGPERTLAKLTRAWACPE